METMGSCFRVSGVLTSTVGLRFRVGCLKAFQLVYELKMPRVCRGGDMGLSHFRCHGHCMFHAYGLYLRVEYLDETILQTYDQEHSPALKP